MTRFLHSRSGVVLAALLSAVLAWLFARLGQAVYPVSDGAIVPAWSLSRLQPGEWGMPVAWALNVAIAALMCQINKAFNLLRGMTMLQGVLFLVMEVATPALMLFLSLGLLLCLALALCSAIMYACYADRDSQRRVFLVFFMLSAGAALDYSFLVFVPVFWLGCAQMRIFSMRTVLASLMGLATPWIIFFGFGLIGPDSLAMPHFFMKAGAEGLSAYSLLLSAAAFTSFVALTAWVQNIMKLLTYNAQSRAMLSLANVVMLMAILASAANLSHAGAFLPVVNFCASLQLAHLFVNTYAGRRSFWGILLIIFIYLAIYSWRLAICIL